MLYLKLSEPMFIDTAFPLAVRVAGLQAGDAVEVVRGSTTDAQIWHPRNGPLPWLRATATTGEFMLDPAQITDQVTFVATMAGHRAVGATIVQMGGTGQTWSHPGATAREGERWSFLSLTSQQGRVTITARDDPANRDRVATRGVTGADAMSAVVDLSASMAPAVADGRLVTALAAVQAAASRSKLSAVTLTFVSGDQTKRVVLPVKAPVVDTLNQVVAETGWRTGTATDLSSALGISGENADVVWVVSDVVPGAPAARPAGNTRRVGYVVTGPPPSAGFGPAERAPVHLVPGESVTELSDRMIGSIAG